MIYVNNFKRGIKMFDFELLILMSVVFHFRHII